jgi:hypothetical protein
LADRAILSSVGHPHRHLHIYRKNARNKRLFAACMGSQKIARIYQYPFQEEVERSCTESNVNALTFVEKHQISSAFLPPGNDAIEGYPGYCV